VHFIKHTAGLLADWLEVRQAVGLDGVSALFVVVGPNGTGTALGPRGIRYVGDKHLSDLGLKSEGISCHALRHSAAAWSRADGARLDAIAGMLGHASVTTTSIYVRIVDRSRRHSFGIAEKPARYLEELMGFG